MTADDVLSVIHMFESAPSAYILARSFTDSPCTDQEMEEAYNRGEGYNDSETESIVRSMTAQQLRALADELLSIGLEHQSYPDDLDELTGGLDIVKMLS